MDRFAIRRLDDMKFVAAPGSKKSYTKSGRDARRFPTVAAAQADCCGNEIVCELER